MNKYLNIAALMFLAGMAANANALCTNPDGSLDDPSVSTATIAVDVLPACTPPVAKSAEAAAPVTAGQASKSEQENAPSNSSTAVQM